MRKISIIFALTVLAVAGVRAQGLISFANGAAVANRISTNSVVGGATTGPVASLIKYYFALFYSTNSASVNGQTTAIVGSASANYAFSSSAWTLAAYGTNTISGRFVTSSATDSSARTAIAGVLPGTPATARFVVVGWSANIGTDMATVKAWFNGGTPGSDGWIGQSVVSSAPLVLGDGNALPTPIVVGTGPDQVTGFTLGRVSTGLYLPPHGVTQATNQTVITNGTANFAVRAQGDPSLAFSYQWQFNGSNVSTAGNYVLTMNDFNSGGTHYADFILTVTNAQAANAGNYSVFISNAAGSVSSSNASLTISSVAATTPVITSQPGNVTVAAGGTATFSIGVNGAAPLGYQWSFNGAGLLNATNASLVLTGVQTGNAGSYTVAITNSYGATNSAAGTLTVTIPPTSGYVIFNNSPAQRIFTNSVLGGAATSPTATNAGLYRYALYVSTNATTVNGRTNALTGNINTNNYAFNDGAWTLVAYGTNSLNFGQLASFSVDSTGKTPVPGIAPGATAQFVVIGWSANVGADVATVRAWLNGTALTGGWIGQSAVSGAITLGDGGGIPTTTLFGNTPPAIPGFTLGLVSIGGVSVAPAILAGGQPADTTGYVGSVASFFVSYSAYPTETFQWRINGTNIVSGTNAVLTLTNLALTDAGSYSVIISNNAGAVTSSNALLTVLPRPGYVFFQNPAISSTKIFTNSAVNGPITGLTAPNAGGYNYALYVSTTAATVNGLATAIQGATNLNYVFNDPAWTLAAYGTNVSPGGRLRSATTDGSGQTPVYLPAGASAARFVVLGWSANIGTNSAAVQSWFNGGHPASDGWIGQSDVSGVVTLGDGNQVPTPTLFGISSPYLNGFNLGLASPVSGRFYAMTYVPAPVLSTIKTGNTVLLSWPAAYSSYGAQSADNFTGPWGDVDGAPTTQGTNLVQTVPAGDQQPYFRLIVK